jgi:non-heme chloroperoxidase
MALPERPTSPVLVLGAHDDKVCTPGDAHATAHHHGVTATILPGMAHMLMLEPEWETAAEALAEWLAQNG